MDPNACLKSIRDLIACIEGRTVEEIEKWPADVAHDAARLAELVDALDVWIRHGGFLPIAWEGKP